MKKFEIPRNQDVTLHNQKILNDLRMAFGFIPNVYAFMAYSPMALNSYLHYTREKTSLSDLEAEAIYLVTSQVNQCLYCLSARTVMAKAMGLTDEQILELRQGKASFDSKLQALLYFTKEVVENRGQVRKEVVERFYKAGFTNRHLVEVVLLISQIMVTNFINNITHNPIDFPLAPPIEGI